MCHAMRETFTAVLTACGAEVFEQRREGKGGVTSGGRNALRAVLLLSRRSIFVDIMQPLVIATPEMEKQNKSYVMLKTAPKSRGPHFLG